MNGSLAVDRYLAWRFHLAKRNCWHLVRESWLELTGRDLGDLTPNKISADALRSAVGTSEPSFDRLAAPADPCIVLMQNPGASPHVGLYHRGKVLQITASGASYMPLRVAAFGYQEVRFYRPCP